MTNILHVIFCFSNLLHKDSDEAQRQLSKTEDHGTLFKHTIHSHVYI